ncbi:HMG1/2-like protein [Formica exsecta]|uniref:HMG1/2-like protein n=1 Tax=Formica exsecta TaxID=72781 RepID=UPI001141DAA4|nr:HMG1/2-like protein [Formica exsecta]
MEDDNRREENNKITGDIENDGTAGPEEKGSGNQYQLIPKSPSNRKSTRNEQYDRRSCRSRSRSCSKPSRRKQWRSANAFLNFMQDFRQDYNKVKSRDLFRLGGQKWRQMSSTEKMPYVEAAKVAQQQSQQNNKNEQQTKPDSGEISKKSDNNQRKKEREFQKRKERKRSRSKTDDSDAESDSATSGTGATMTSEDVSDLSS